MQTVGEGTENVKHQDLEDLLTPAEVGEIISRTPNRVYQIIGSHQLPFTQVNGAKRIRRADALAYKELMPERISRVNAARVGRLHRDRDPGYERTKRAMISLTGPELERLKDLSESFGGGRSVTRGIRALLVIYHHSQSPFTVGGEE